MLAVRARVVQLLQAKRQLAEGDAFAIVARQREEVLTRFAGRGRTRAKNDVVVITNDAAPMGLLRPFASFNPQ